MLLQKIAEELKVYKNIPNNRSNIPQINEAYSKLNLICQPLRNNSIYLNLDESHYGSRLWFDCGVLSTRFFWKNEKLQTKNDNWTSYMGPFYFKGSCWTGKIDETWDEAINDAQNKLNKALSDK